MDFYRRSLRKYRLVSRRVSFISPVNSLYPTLPKQEFSAFLIRDTQFGSEIYHLMFHKMFSLLLQALLR